MCERERERERERKVFLFRSRFERRRLLVSLLKMHEEQNHRDDVQTTFQ